MTNREKFEEVFGFPLYDDMHCPFPTECCYPADSECFNCPLDKFWEKEYKPCFRIDMSKIKGEEYKRGYKEGYNEAMKDIGEGGEDE